MKKIILLVLFLYSSISLAISEKDVVKSAFMHYPKIKQDILKFDASYDSITEANGAFDAKLKGEKYNHSYNKYKGDFHDIVIEKDFAFLGAKLKTGFRKSGDEFPDYEGHLDTRGSGQGFISMQFSILRNALIDDARYSVSMMEENSLQRELALNQTRIVVQTAALKAYWNWYVSGLKLKVQERLLELAENRVNNIKKRIAAGDLADIYLIENQQYIYKRKSQNEKLAFEFTKASLYLSLFYRNPAGKPITLSREDMPQEKALISGNYQFNQKLLKDTYLSNLNLKGADSKIRQADLDGKLGYNEYLPKLNLKYEHRRQLDGNEEESDENKFLLSLEIPLQYRKAKGKLNKAARKKMELQLDKEFIKEKLAIELKSIIAKLDTYVEVYNLSAKQEKASAILSESELRKFNQGASDLIRVNLREQDLASAQTAKLEALLNYHFAESELLLLKVEEI